MTRNEIITKTKDLEESLRQAHPVDQKFYEELLEEYEVYIMSLKLIGDSYPWERALEIQDKHQSFERALPRVDEETFVEYILLGDLLAVLLGGRNG